MYALSKLQQARDKQACNNHGIELSEIVANLTNNSKAQIPTGEKEELRSAYRVILIPKLNMSDERRPDSQLGSFIKKNEKMVRMQHIAYMEEV